MQQYVSQLFERVAKRQHATSAFCCFVRGHSSLDNRHIRNIALSISITSVPALTVTLRSKTLSKLLCLLACTAPQDFGEIAFCAVAASQQVRGFGTRLMNHTKAFARDKDNLTHFLTYADNNAVGYFTKQV